MTTPRPFTDTLRALGHGECMDLLTDGLHSHPTQRRAPALGGQPHWSTP